MTGRQKKGREGVREESKKERWEKWIREVRKEGGKGHYSVGLLSIGFILNIKYLRLITLYISKLISWIHFLKKL